MLQFQTISNLLSRHQRTLEDFATSYGEKGYSDPKSGILLANWNDIPAYIIKGLERRGFELEWSDEWICANDKAYRTSADSHGWKPYYVLHEGEVIGGDEIENGTEAEWYVETYLLNDPAHACVFNVDLSKHGFTKLDEDFETGFHPGQTDNPKAIFAKHEATHDVVFEIADVGQFDVRWNVWLRAFESDLVS